MSGGAPLRRAGLLPGPYDWPARGHVPGTVTVTGSEGAPGLRDTVRSWSREGQCRETCERLETDICSGQ